MQQASRPGEFGQASVDAEVISEIARLHGLGKSRREISEMLDLSLPTVTKYVKELGLKFPAPQLEIANKARSTYLQQKRQELAEKLLDDAEMLRRQLFEPYTDSAFVGGAKPQHITEKLDKPKARDQADIMRAVSTALTSIDKLTADKHDANSDAKSVLEGLGEALKAAAGANEAASDDANAAPHPLPPVAEPRSSGAPVENSERPSGAVGQTGDA
jgi:hypothetical protein